MAAAKTRVRIKGTNIILKQRGFEPAYDAQSTGRRVRNWIPTSSGINRAMLGNLQTQRNRSRDVIRKVPWIASAVDSYCANLVGTGIRPNSQARDEGRRRAANELFSYWVDEADADGLVDFQGLLEMAIRSLPGSGEMFFRFRHRRESDGLTVPLQIQALDAEYVPLDKTETLPNGNRIIAGIEFDKLGRRVAYHMYREHPNDIITGSRYNNLVRVPASDVLHFFKPESPGQVRGIPGLSPVVMRVRDLLEYEDAELVRKKTAAMFTAFVTRPAIETDMFANAAGGEADDGFELVDVEDDGVGMTELEPGTMQMLEPGESVEFSSPADVGGNYEAFVKMQLHAIAAGIGITYDQMTGDVKDVNFSTVRAGMLEFQRRARQRQKLLAFQVCRRIWLEWFKKAVLAGALKAPGYVGGNTAQSRVMWIYPGWRYVNPKDEVAAATAMIRAGLISRTQAVAELGHDIQAVDEQIAKDNTSADQKGLIFDSDPRKTTNAGLVADHSETDGKAA